MAVAGRWVYLSLLLLLGLLWRALAAEQLALLEVFLEQRPVVSTTLQGQVLDPGRTKGSEPRDEEPEGLEGELVLVYDEDGLISTEPSEGEAKQSEPWIAVVPVEMDDIQASTGNQESFTDVVNRMKRALVLGASALIILALNQNTVTEMDVSLELSKPIIVIQTSENVTKLFGALLRGLQATVKITYRTILQDDLGATLTLWSSCGRSPGGRYGKWQGVICTGETSSQVQKYLQQLWDTVLLVALILSTGVLVQAHWQYQDHRLDTQLQAHCSHKSLPLGYVLI